MNLSATMHRVNEAQRVRLFEPRVENATERLGAASLGGTSLEAQRPGQARCTFPPWITP